MKFHDITNELFEAAIYPNDPLPKKETILSLGGENPDSCQITELTFGSHNGSHLDAPLHFYKDGKDVAHIPLDKCIGNCKVVAAEGTILKEQVVQWLTDGTNRLLIQGNIELTIEAAETMNQYNLQYLGVEGLTVGSFESLKEVHLELLGEEVVIAENLNLKEVQCGAYYLISQPLRMEGLDGSPVRAVLLDGLEQSLEKLKAYECMHQALLESQRKTIADMEELKEKGKTNSATYKQLLVKKLTNQNILSMYQIYGVIG